MRPALEHLVDALSRDTVFNIEKGVVQARGASMEKIVQAFLNNGIEFIENGGVRIKQQGVEILSGEKGLCQFFDGVYEYTKAHGGTIKARNRDGGGATILISLPATSLTIHE